ncbi:hypothetical protein [Roseovarius rhodophyticola]|uniref:Uncharacterized protein n=1 Tax=Roseovarius rhodophyticola TaxID=3080827 RepID=A0ABZ2THR7_9RHOB|nr:hypothetical protein [Roseovarius sp. W115]MDV2929498.1 hypothetical protein [Roseovarius sp. W115]
MTELGAKACIAILLGWVAFAVTGLVLPAWLALICAVGAGGACATILRKTIGINGFVALLAPFGVMLPALALRDVAVAFGIPIPGFAAFEIGVFLLLYTGFLLAAFGKLPLDLYRYGYAPKPVAIMVLVVCAYALLTGNWFLATVAVLAQGIWTLGWGSSNWLDHVLHVVLWPVAAVVLLTQLI